MTTSSRVAPQESEYKLLSQQIMLGTGAFLFVVRVHCVYGKVYLKGAFSRKRKGEEKHE